MDKPTLPQQAELCRKLTLDAIKGSARGLTVRQIHAQLRASGERGMTERAVRKSVYALEESGTIDSETPGNSALRTYFVEANPPRPGARWVSALAVPPMGRAPGTWFSALGAPA